MPQLPTSSFVPPKIIPHIETGSIFWFRSDGQGQEEQEEHPWIVISTPLAHRKSELVLAVPCTSVDMEHAFHVSIQEGDIRRWPNVDHPLSLKKPIRIAKASKIRHFSVDRIVVVGLITNQDRLREIRGEIMSMLGV